MNCSLICQLKFQSNAEITTMTLDINNSEIEKLVFLRTSAKKKYICPLHRNLIYCFDTEVLHLICSSFPEQAILFLNSSPNYLIGNLGQTSLLSIEIASSLPRKFLPSILVYLSHDVPWFYVSMYDVMLSQVFHS